MHFFFIIFVILSDAPAIYGRRAGKKSGRRLEQGINGPCRLKAAKEEIQD